MRIACLFDPLCGWCYGAGPALEKLAQLDGVALELAPTGLFAEENARRLDASFAAYAWRNDQRIARLTGQVFSDAYRRQILEPGDRLFDSAPATLGFVAVGLTEPAGELEALTALQRARYVDGRDNADLAVVADVLAEAGFAEAARRARSPDAIVLEVYRRRIAEARSDMVRFGAEGVPALVVGDGDERRLAPGGLLFGGLDGLSAGIQGA